MTFDERYTVLSALIDREAIDPDALAAALDEPAARAMLVDFVRLRRELLHDDAADDVRTNRELAPRRLPLRWWRLAAAVLLPLAMGVASGWWIGDWSRQERPPTPSRVVSFTPGVDWNKQ